MAGGCEMSMQQDDSQRRPEMPDGPAQVFHGQHVVDEGPACLTCRKRKLRCSRESPTCSSCIRLSTECIYDKKRQKPGVKAGAIETLTRRLGALERRLEERDEEHFRSQDLAYVEVCLSRAFSLIADQLRPNCSTSPCSGLTGGPRLECESNDPSVVGIPCQTLSRRSYRPLKRRRLTEPAATQETPATGQADLAKSLPPQALLDSILCEYFATIHHWIPMVHQTRLRNRLRDQGATPNLAVLLHAMTAVTLKRISPEESGLAQAEMEERIDLSRDLVMLHALNDLNIENLQALIMITFDKIGSGDISGAWPLVGSLTRTVDYLQLTVEPNADGKRSLLEPLQYLETPKDFAEAEERRRIFWNVFLLDRFCSVACGWNTGFTSDNVSRQLPCNGGLWARNEHAAAPFFGLWDKQAAKMGNSITFLPVHRATQTDQGQMHNVSPGGPPETDIRSNLGAVAYRIEATESLSQISSFFLQQRVDFYNREEVTNWLTRFKELDLRLVHWKLFLPRKWKDSNVSADEAQVRMDPNLTLAHIMHNASMILLHQHIAYPTSTLNQIVNLPSTCSAETCQLAAVETASIARKYLKYTKDIMVNSEFAFCTFLAARVLLVNCRYFDIELAPEFFELIQSLDEMSSRWHGKQRLPRSEPDGGIASSAALDLAGRYATYLRQLHAMATGNVTFSTDFLFQPGASLLMPIDTQLGTSPFTQPPTNQHERNGLLVAGSSSIRTGQPLVQRQISPNSVRTYEAHTRAQYSQDRHQASPSASYPNHNLSAASQTSNVAEAGSACVSNPNQGGSSIQPSGPGVAVPLSTAVPEPYGPSMQYPHPMPPSLIEMSDTILGQQFANLDRVITFDGADFALDGTI